MQPGSHDVSSEVQSWMRKVRRGWAEYFEFTSILDTADWVTERASTNL